MTVREVVRSTAMRAESRRVFLRFVSRTAKPTALRTIRIFISSPGDVAEERLLARRLIGRLDAQFGGALQFEAILWERFPLVATASFQEQLQKPSDADIVIVVLWSRLGTPRTLWVGLSFGASE